METVSEENKSYDLGHMQEMRPEISQELRRQDALGSSIGGKSFKIWATHKKIGLSSILLCSRKVGEQFKGTELCQGNREQCIQSPPLLPTSSVCDLGQVTYSLCAKEE